MTEASSIILLCPAFRRVSIAWRADPAALVKTYPDAGTYLSPARSLIERGKFLNSAGEPDAHGAPGCLIFLAIVMSLIGRDLHTVLIFQAVVLSFQVLALYWLARRILPPAMAF
jgi:4-amino-4-deoxy-L-arabinose transferase-like glycosyltransferase